MEERKRKGKRKGKEIREEKENGGLKETSKES